MAQVIIITPFYPPSIGGMENAVERIAVGLSRQGVVVEVHTSLVNCAETTCLDQSVVNLTVVRSGHSLVAWGLAAQEWAKERNPDAVILTSFGPDYRDQMISICRNFRYQGVRVVWRSPTSDHAKRNLASRLLDISALLDVVVANSAASAHDTEETLAMPVEVIPNMLLGEELEAARVDSELERLAGMTWVGRVTARKNPLAMARILRDFSKEYLVCVQAAPAYGEDGLFDAFLDALGPRVTVAPPGSVPPLEVRLAATFIHLSSVEGSPNAVLEACARGSFPLVRSIPACVELVAGIRHVLVDDPPGLIAPVGGRAD